VLVLHDLEGYDVSSKAGLQGANEDATLTSGSGALRFTTPRQVWAPSRYGKSF
jgi:hypothetical protein